MKKRFSRWAGWADRHSLDGLQCPGVYAIARSNSDLKGQVLSWCPEVIYIGMTNSKGGLKSRLHQFDNTIRGGKGHGGAQRVRFKHSDYAPLARKLYVAVQRWECNVESNTPRDLRIMGDIARSEYDCLAAFAQRFRQLPEFNDKKRSPKK